MFLNGLSENSGYTGFMKKNKTIGIIGFGNMGSALGLALKENGWQVNIYDKDRRRLKKKRHIVICKDSRDLIKKSPIVIVAVKPQDILPLLEETKNLISTCKPLIISIAAGVSTSFFERRIKGLKIIRVMPNLAAKKRQSVSFVSKGKFAKSGDLALAGSIFTCVGSSFTIGEVFLDKATAISGSGPGYIYYFMECLYSSAVMLGFKKNIAKKMVILTFLGAVNLIKDENIDFSDWIQKVSSKGGTTEAALGLWEKKGLKKLIQQGVNSAYSRAKELNNYKGVVNVRNY